MSDLNFRAWYALRRTLTPRNFNELLAELSVKSREWRIDEVIIKVDTEEFSHGHPAVEWLAGYQKQLFTVKEELEQLGIVYSLNPWLTLGHADRGRREEGRISGFQGMVGDDGSECHHCACPLSPGWREHLFKLWKIYAETRPRVIWVEDDFRNFNHAPVKFGCFCPLHLKLFSEAIGREVSREELVKALLAPGRPHPWREIYLGILRETMIELAGQLSGIVHSVSPETAIGLMSSGPRQHEIEGRDWRRLCDAFAAGGRLYSRPPLANYNEDSLRGLYYSHDSIKLTRRMFPAGTVEQTEVENFPFSRFSKSVAFTRLQIALSFAYGADGVTLNLFDHLGTPMASEAAYGTMLAADKEYFGALASLARGKGRWRGVRLIHHPRNALYKHLSPGASFRDLGGDGYAMMLALEGVGIPTVYDEEEGVAAVSGQSLRALEDVEIERLLSGGLLLDAVAARILIERGFVADIGVESVTEERPRGELDFIISAEEYFAPEFGGRAGCFLSSLLPMIGVDTGFPHLTPAAGASVVSRWVNPDAEPVAPAMSAFVNARGGRVVVHGLDYNHAVGLNFFSPPRRRMFQQVFRFLCGGAVPVSFESDGAWPLAWRRDSTGQCVLGVFNLNLDSWRRECFRIAWDHERLPEIFRLEPDGTLRRTEHFSAVAVSGELEITGEQELDFRYPLVLVLKY